MRTHNTSRSLATILAFALVSLSMLALLLTSGLQLWSTTQSQQVAIASNQQLVAQDAAKSVRNFIEQRYTMLTAAGRLTGLVTQLPEQQTEVLQRLLGLEPAFLELLLLDAQGQTLAHVSRLSLVNTRISNESFVNDSSRLIQQGEQYISRIFIDPTTSEPEVLIAVPVTDVFGDFQGTLASIMNLKFMWDLVDQLDVGEQGLAYVIDRQGNLLAFRDTARVLRGENVGHIKEVQDFIEHTHEYTGQFLDRYTGILGTDVVGSYAALNTPDWAVIIETPWTVAYRGVINNAGLVIGILLSVTILAGVIGAYVARRLTLPLVNLMHTANRIAGGEHELQASISGPREVAGLAHAFNVMTAQLRSILEGLEQRVTQRTADLATALARVEAQAREQARLLEENAQQRQAIRELSVPVLPVTSEILVMPLIGVVDTERLADIQERASQALARTSAYYLLLDITGVPVVDSQVAQGLLGLAATARLLGAEMILIGVQPEVAQTIVGLGLDLTSLRTEADLQTVLHRVNRRPHR